MHRTAHLARHSGNPGKTSSPIEKWTCTEFGFLSLTLFAISGVGRSTEHHHLTPKYGTRVTCALRSKDDYNTIGNEEKWFLQAFRTFPISLEDEHPPRPIPRDVFRVKGEKRE
jgi:hypothetical protein